MHMSRIHRSKGSLIVLYKKVHDVFIPYESNQFSCELTR